MHPCSLFCTPWSMPASVGALTHAQALVVQALSGWVCAAGCAGLHPTVAAIKAGKDICLANKETLIAGGPYVLPLAREHGVKILPADSEHSVSLFCASCTFYTSLESQAYHLGRQQAIIMTLET